MSRLPEPYKTFHVYIVKSTNINVHRKKRFTSFPSSAGMSLTKLPVGRINSVMTSLFPPRESLVVTSRLGTRNFRTFFFRCKILTILKGTGSTDKYFLWRPVKLNQYFLYMLHGFQIEQNINIWLASIGLLSTESREFMSGSVINGRFWNLKLENSVRWTCHSRFSEQFTDSQAGYEATFWMPQ